MSKLNFKIFLIEDDGSFAELESENLGDDFTTSFSATDLTNISTRTDNISKNITLKATPVNNRVLGNLYNLSRFTDTTLPERLYYNFSPNRGVQCQIFEDSVMIFKGTLKVTGVDCDSSGNYTYSAVVIGNLINFLGKIGNDMLSDVFVIDYQHFYTLPTIINSWDRNYSDGLALPYRSFFYPQIDYGKGIVPNPTKFDMRNFRTSVYLSGYFDNIFSKYGYTYSGNFINSDVFKKAFIPYNEPEFSKKTKEIVYSDVATGATTYTFTTESPNSPINLGTIVDSSIIKRVTRTYSGVDVHSYVLTRNVTSQITLNLNYTAALVDGLDSNMDVVLFQIDTAGTPNISIAKPLNFSITSGITTLTLPLKTYLKGESFAIIASTDADSASLTINRGEFKIGDTGIVSQVDIISGDTVNIRDVVPQNVLVKDFLKNILTFFNLYLIENPNIPNGILIEPFDTFYQKAITPAQYAYDWTKKVDSKSATKLTFNTQLPTAYNFKFKEDSDDYYGGLYSDKYNETYGDYSIINCKGVADPLDIEVLFSPTIVVKENGDDKILPAIYKGELTNKESFKSNIRILYNNGYSICSAYDIVTTSGTSESVSYTTLSTGLIKTNQSSTILKDSNGNDVFSLLFGVPNEVYMPVTQSIFTVPNIYTDFYENQILELNDDNVSVFELSVLLSASDIANLDLRTPVFIQNKNGGMYAKILNVDYYNSNETSQVKLQKIVL